MNPHSALAQAESLLLAPFSLSEGDLTRTFGQILTHQVDYADLYFQYSRSEAWSLDEGIVKSGSFNIDQGVGVRAISGEKTAFAYSDDISSRALTDAAVTEEDIRAGRLDRAAVWQWLVDWTDPELRILMFRGEVGEIRRKDHAFEVELRASGEGPQARTSVLCTYNPPVSPWHWVNREACAPPAGRLQHHSDYRDMPAQWLGDSFLAEADLRESQSKAVCCGL